MSVAAIAVPPASLACPTDRQRAVRVWVAVVAILAVAVAARCHDLASRPLWTDEYFSMECSAGWGRSDLRVADTHEAAPDLTRLDDARSWGDVWSSMARDENHPPGYALLLRAWRTAFGDGPAGLRSLSVLTSVLAVGLTIGAGWELAGPACGLWAGLAMAVASPQIREAQDARAYMPVAAAAAGALWVLARIARRGPTAGRAVGLAVLLAVLPMLHYMAGATVGAAVVFAVIALRGPARRAVVWVAVAAISVDLAIWGPALVGQRHRMVEATQWMAQTPVGGPAWGTWGEFAAAPIRLLVDPATQLTSGVAVGGIVALLVPLLAVIAARRSGRWRVLLPWAWVAVPLLTALAIDLSANRHSLQFAKYTLVGGPALCLLAGLLAATGRRLAWVPAAGVVAAGLLCLPAVYDSIEPDWHPLAQFVLSHSARSDPVVLFANDGPDGSPDEATGARVAALSYWLHGPDHRDMYVVRAGEPIVGPVLTALRQSNHICLCGSSFTAADIARLPSLTVDHSELFVGLGLVGTADRLPPPGAVAAAAARSRRPH